MAAIERFSGWITERQKAYVIFCTVSSVLSARKDGQVGRVFREADMVTPDGMPLVWLGRRAGVPTERVYGPDFMLDLIAATGGRFRHFFYGGAPGVADEMVVRLRERFPDLQVAGAHSPPFGFDATQPAVEDVARINESGADIVWVGIGHPRQDLWMHTNRAALEAPVLAGVGAAFDFHAGRVKEAPGWMKRSGLQWLHRLASDPRRLWKRYVLGNAEFLYLLARERLGR